MNIKTYLKCIVIFGACQSLQSFTFPYVAFVKNELINSHIIQKIFLILDKCEWDNQLHFSFSIAKSRHVFFKAQNCRFFAWIRPFYKKSSGFENKFYLCKKAFFGINTIRKLGHKKNKSKKCTELMLKKIKDEQKQLAEHSTITLGQLAIRIEKKLEQNSNKLSEIYTYTSAKSLIEKLSEYMGDVEGQSMIFRDKLEHDVFCAMRTQLDRYHQFPKDKKNRLNLIKSHKLFAKETQKLIILYDEEYEMNHNFFEKLNQIGQKELRITFRKLHSTCQQIEEYIERNQSVLPDAFQQLKERKEQLIGFVDGALLLISHLNLKLQCLYARITDRIASENKLKPIIELALGPHNSDIEKYSLYRSQKSFLIYPKCCFNPISNKPYQDFLRKSEIKFERCLFKIKNISDNDRL